MGLKKTIKRWIALQLKSVLAEATPVRFSNTSNLTTGKDSFHNGNFEIRGKGKLKIGSYCALGKDIKIITSNHNYNFASLQYGFYNRYFNQKPYSQDAASLNEGYAVIIEHDVWIGDNVIILPNVTIATGAIIAAGSVVSKDVAAYTIVGGVPAKQIKDRFDSQTKQMLLSSAWWNWSEEEIKKNKDFFFKNYNQ